MFKFKNNLFFARKGQGILEVVIAISVVVIGLVSIISLVVFNINVQSYNHNMLIASNLAREGIEVIRNIRDNNWLNSEWDNGLITANSSPLSEEKGFLFRNLYLWGFPIEYDIHDLGCSWEECVYNDSATHGPTPAKISLMEQNGHFLYDQFGHSRPGTNQDTNFYRVIFINEICSTNGTDEEIITSYDRHCENYAYERIGLQVISKVGWINKGTMRTIEVEERLYNWK